MDGEPSKLVLSLKHRRKQSNRQAGSIGIQMRVANPFFASVIPVVNLCCLIVSIPFSLEREEHHAVLVWWPTVVLSQFFRFRPLIPLFHQAVNAAP